jgi:hypothetical protein
MNKPIPRVMEPAYNWFECERYFSEVFGKSLQDNFWRWFTDIYQFGNGSLVFVDWSGFDDYEDLSEEIREIIDLFKSEFGSCMNFWIEW